MCISSCGGVLTLIDLQAKLRSWVPFQNHQKILSTIKVEAMHWSKLGIDINEDFIFSHTFPRSKNIQFTSTDFQLGQHGILWVTKKLHHCLLHLGVILCLISDKKRVPTVFDYQSLVIRLAYAMEVCLGSFFLSFFVF